VYFTTGDRIYYLDVGAGTINEDQPVLDIAARLARRYASVPAAPATGNAEADGAADGIPALVAAGLIVMTALLAVAGASVAFRRWR
jgi:hypothetical protein